MTNPSTAAARVVVDELVAQGVVEVVLAPGSRSAALALALADADRHGRLRLHVRVDERTAAFLALGLAKAGGSPAAVVTTSGSAAANLAPAATEAAYSGVPLLLLTADRPPELRGTGANQSVDHRAILGGIVVASLDLGVPERRVGAVAAWRSTLARAVALADDPHRPGPVHLDLPFRDPLVPGEDDEPWPEPIEGRRDADGDPRPFTLDRRRAAEAQAETLSDVLAAVDRHAVPAHGLVVVGDGVDEDAADAALALAAGCGWPVISEPSGNARRGPQALAHASLTAPGVTAALGAPEVVVAVGRVGLSRSITALLRTAATLVWWPCPAATVERPGARCRRRRRRCPHRSRWGTCAHVCAPAFPPTRPHPSASPPAPTRRGPVAGGLARGRPRARGPAGGPARRAARAHRPRRRAHAVGRRRGRGAPPRRGQPSGARPRGHREGP
jgi:2-succinyl-5-enolpyruvyl-6-hydroxy-3-cyclohexene-1-carboxylate synthase